MTPEELNKACEWLNARLFPTVKVQNEDLIDVIDRWELIDEFRKAMGNDLLTSANHRTLTWEDIRRIVEIADMLADNQEPDNLGRFPSMEAYYTEVLTRFNEQRK